MPLMISTMAKDSFYAEASDLGWKAGEWPESFEADGRRWVRSTFAKNKEGDLVYTTYVSGQFKLDVYND